MIVTTGEDCQTDQVGAANSEDAVGSVLFSQFDHVYGFDDFSTLPLTDVDLLFDGQSPQWDTDAGVLVADLTDLEDVITGCEDDMVVEAVVVLAAQPDGKILWMVVATIPLSSVHNSMS